MSENLVRMLSGVRISDTIVEDQGRLFLGRKILPLGRDAATIDVLADALMDSELIRRGDGENAGGDFYTLIEPGSARKALVLTNEGLKMLSTQPDVMERFAALAPRKEGVYYPDWMATDYHQSSRNMGRRHSPQLRTENSPLLRRALAKIGVFNARIINDQVALTRHIMNTFTGIRAAPLTRVTPKRITFDLNGDGSINVDSAAFDSTTAHEQAVKETARQLDVALNPPVAPVASLASLMPNIVLSQQQEGTAITGMVSITIHAPELEPVATAHRLLNEFTSAIMHNPSPGVYNQFESASGQVADHRLRLEAENHAVFTRPQSHVLQAAFANPEHAKALATELFLNGIEIENQMGRGVRR